MLGSMEAVSRVVTARGIGACPWVFQFVVARVTVCRYGQLDNLCSNTKTDGSRLESLSQLIAI